MPVQEGDGAFQYVQEFANKIGYSPVSMAYFKSNNCRIYGIDTHQELVLQNRVLGQEIEADEVGYIEPQFYVICADREPCFFLNAKSYVLSVDKGNDNHAGPVLRVFSPHSTEELSLSDPQLQNHRKTIAAFAKQMNAIVFQPEIKSYLSILDI